MDKHKFSRILWVLLIGVTIILISQLVLAESTYLLNGAEISTINYSSEGVYRGRTSSAGAPAFYRVYANIRAWGSPPNALKDEKFHDCYHCTSTDSRVRVANIYAYTITRHIARREIGQTEYVGYTSMAGGAWSSYKCWSGNCLQVP